MTYFVIKILVTALIVALISELSRRYNLMAAALASLPLVSILAFIWIYLESNNTQRLIVLSQDIFWLVLPSLAFFLLFPLLLKQVAILGSLNSGVFRHDSTLCHHTLVIENVFLETDKYSSAIAI